MIVESLLCRCERICRGFLPYFARSQRSARIHGGASARRGAGASPTGELFGKRTDVGLCIAVLADISQLSSICGGWRFHQRHSFRHRQFTAHHARGLSDEIQIEIAR
jgi:hypothetical protein